MKTLFWCLLLGTSPFLAVSNADSPPTPYVDQGEKKSAMFSAASSEASHWLNLLDQSQYSASWLDAGPILKDVITKDQWKAALQATRRPLGLVNSRKVGEHQAKESLPSGIKGNFMVIQYETDFSAKKGAVETVTLMMIKNDQWRAISYSVK